MKVSESDSPASKVADMLDVFLHQKPQRASATLPLVGRLVGIAADGVPLVCHAAQTSTAALRARTTIVLGADDIGSDVVLLFEDGDPGAPLVIGRLVANAGTPVRHQSVEVDGDRIIVAAEGELVLRCGAAVITLTRDGRITLSGSHVVSRSAGANRVQGASIELN